MATAGAINKFKTLYFSITHTQKVNKLGFFCMFVSVFCFVALNMGITSVRLWLCCRVGNLLGVFRWVFHWKVFQTHSGTESCDRILTNFPISKRSKIYGSAISQEIKCSSILFFIIYTGCPKFGQTFRGDSRSDRKQLLF